MRMTLAEFKADYQRETGTVMSRDAWRVLYSQYCEHDAEAIAGGRDDVAPLVEEFGPVDRTGYSNHSQNCYESFHRGAECSCGLMSSFDGDGYTDEDGGFISTTPTIEPSVTAIQPSGINPHPEWDDIPF